MLSRCLLLTAFTILPLTVACSSDPDPTGPLPGAPDAAAPDSPDAGDDPGPGTTARLTGVVSRSAAPQGDAMGNVFVALFDRDPVSNMDTAQVVGQVMIENANLATAGTSVPYTLEGVPPRAEDYFMIAFLDDNGNVDISAPDSAGPDRGDLVSLNGVSSPKVTIATAGDHAHDVDLNLVMPF